MADLREDLLTARYRTETALVALDEGGIEAAEQYLAEAQRAIEVAGKRKRLPEEVFFQRIPHSSAAKIFKDRFGQDD